MPTTSLIGYFALLDAAVAVGLQTRSGRLPGWRRTLVDDQKKTKGELIDELCRLRTRLSGLERNKLTGDRDRTEPSEKDLYRVLFDSACEGILIADVATKRFVHANPAICRMLGYTREQLLRMSVKDIHPPESLDQVMAEFEIRASSERPIACELPCLRSDGGVFCANISASRAVIDGRTCGVGFFSDVTERRQAYDLVRLQCDLAVTLNSATDLKVALRQCLDTAITASGMDSGGVYLVDAETGALDLECHAGLSQNFVQTCSHYDAHAPNTRLVLAGNPVYLTHRELVAGLKSNSHPEGLRAIAVIPVIHGERVIACLNVASHTFDDVPEEVRRTLQAIAAAIGSTVTRLRAEQALALTEARYHEVFNTVQEGIGIVDDNETILLANPAYARIFDEESVEAIVGRSLLDYLPDHLREFILKQTARRRANKASKYELDIVTKKGNHKTIFVSVIPRFDSEGRYIGAVGAVLDISDRKSAEEELRRAEEQYRHLFEGAGEGILVAQGGFIRLANPAMSAITGYSREELVATPFAEFLHPDDRAMVVERHRQRSLGAEASTNYDFRIVTKRGDVRILNISATVISWAGQPASLNFLTDVTERRQTEEELRKFKTISDKASYGTAISDLDGNLLYANETFAQMHGYTAEEVRGQNLAIFHSDAQIDMAPRICQDLVRTGSITSVEVRHRRKNGTEFPTLMNGMVINDDQGQPKFLTATVVDITELKRLQEFADRAQRLETAGRIAGQVAHDFNNLLGPLMAYPDFIRQDIDGDSRINTYLEAMEAAAQQMADINQQLLTLGRRGHYNLEPLNLNEVVHQVLRQLHLESDTVAIKTDLAADLMNIKGGFSQVMRAISNLVANAVDAMHGTGTLHVTTENWYADESGGGVYGQIARGEYVRVTISDTGCGIPDGLLAQVFEPFFTTKKADKKRGSGLGLSVVHAVVQDHNGHIDIESMVGQGTSVYLYFPITREEVERADDAAVTGGSETVLVVDDDVVQREVTLKLLQKLGYRAEAVNSGEAALEQLQTRTFDLLLLDMIMPVGLDGLDTYKKVTEVNPEQKALIVSGFAEERRVAETQLLGAGAFLRKPLTLKALANAIRRELDRTRTPEPAG